MLLYVVWVLCVVACCVMGGMSSVCSVVCGFALCMKMLGDIVIFRICVFLCCIVCMFVCVCICDFMYCVFSL